MDPWRQFLDGRALIALHCDDPGRHFPAIRLKVEVDLQGLRVRRRRRQDQIFYLKGRYLSRDDPSREAQVSIDEKLVRRGLVSADGDGPSWAELQSALSGSA